MKEKKKIPPANAELMSSIPGLGRFHMPWGNQALMGTTTAEPVLSSLQAATTEAHTS